MSISKNSSNPLRPAEFLSSAGLRHKVVELEPEESFFGQGDPADSVFCLQKGRAKLTVVSRIGKQATITFLHPGDFFGEESLATAPGVRMATAAAVNTCTAIKITRDEMTRVMHREQAFSDQFLSFLVARSLRTQADLVDHIFNSSKMRLARALLLMAEQGKSEDARTFIAPVTQQTLAEMIGTTRSRVSFFMNRFRDLGLIEYKGRIQVHTPRLKAVLLDQFAET
ncbi:MAG: Crp/Fnr family transcriptional regulator [Terracidiphilus sp.]|nr:Crp/Fnr family transcriptional regulator [Terracidiphilus sp.]